MTFRDGTARCAACDAGLDLVGTRYVCGMCGGALVQPAELGKLLNELSPDDERPLEQRVFSSGLAGTRCPRCTAQMIKGWIHDSGLEQCSEHGVWITRDAMERLFRTHADLHAERNREQTKLIWLAFVPLVNAIAAPLNTAILPWAKRRRLRKYLAKTTPPKR